MQNSRGQLYICISGKTVQNRAIKLRQCKCKTLSEDQRQALYGQFYYYYLTSIIIIFVILLLLQIYIAHKTHNKQNSESEAHA